MGSDNRCHGTVIPKGMGIQIVRCPNNGSLVRDGKSYCKRHDPVAKKEREDAKSKAWNEKWNRERASSERARECVLAMTDIPDPARFVSAANELRRLVRCFGDCDYGKLDDGTAKKFCEACAAAAEFDTALAAKEAT